MDAKEIVKALREHAEWAQANEWECPITLGDVLRKAADTIEELNDFQGSQCAKLLAQLSELRAENARLRAERDKAVADMKVMAIAMRESEELSEGCCFACIYDAQNLPDNVMLAYGECPGYDRDDCFEWRGTEGKA